MTLPPASPTDAVRSSPPDERAIRASPLEEAATTLAVRVDRRRRAGRLPTPGTEFEDRRQHRQVFHIGAAIRPGPVPSAAPPFRSRRNARCLQGGQQGRWLAGADAETTAIRELQLDGVEAPDAPQSSIADVAHAPAVERRVSHGSGRHDVGRRDPLADEADRTEADDDRRAANFDRERAEERLGHRGDEAHHTEESPGSHAGGDEGRRFLLQP